jgi:hypothetical protein
MAGGRPFRTPIRESSGWRVDGAARMPALRWRATSCRARDTLSGSDGGSVYHGPGRGESPGTSACAQRSRAPVLAEGASRRTRPTTQDGDGQPACGTFSGRQSGSCAAPSAEMARRKSWRRPIDRRRGAMASRLMSRDPGRDHFGRLDRQCEFRSGSVIRVARGAGSPRRVSARDPRSGVTFPRIVGCGGAMSPRDCSPPLR